MFQRSKAIRHAEVRFVILTTKNVDVSVSELRCNVIDKVELSATPGV